ncbi:hypothetical protein [Clostridium felsineum]|uniref:hypothetical protein n=1 Tax=Clostridium felsineum TaxID=36839 RepID=UPI0009CBF06D|nr:hypothetical protein [Clostridium felsineum]URZ16893.1 hypothetical protein CLFE_029400 [Clostridium felsineum DSM 794]
MGKTVDRVRGVEILGHLIVENDLGLDVLVRVTTVLAYTNDSNFPQEVARLKKILEELI